jgi:hypothetical protein
MGLFHFHFHFFGNGVLLKLVFMNETVFDVTAAGDLRGQIDDDGDEMIRMGNAMIFLDLCSEFYMNVLRLDLRPLCCPSRRQVSISKGE